MFWEKRLSAWTKIAYDLSLRHTFACAKLEFSMAPIPPEPRAAVGA
jgi:hypothetical protein